VHKESRPLGAEESVPRVFLQRVRKLLNLLQMSFMIEDFARDKGALQLWVRAEGPLRPAFAIALWQGGSPYNSAGGHNPSAKLRTGIACH
jgi:hypothetical protein